MCVYMRVSVCVCVNTMRFAFVPACSWQGRRHFGDQLRLHAEAAASLKHPFGSQDRNVGWKLWVV